MNDADNLSRHGRACPGHLRLAIVVYGKGRPRLHSDKSAERRPLRGRDQ
jgi:hypothetical protein